MAKDVDWSSYAKAYDLVLEYNPEYQKILDKFKAAISKWDIDITESILDIGAGTGNFTLVAAKKFPKHTVYYVDADKAMYTYAKYKMEQQQINNITLINASINNIDLTSFNNLQAVICVHALYVMKNPQQLLEQMYQALASGGYIFICDPGRIMDVNDWKKFYIKYLFNNFGLVKTLKIFWQGRQVIKQNRRIRHLQEDGTYWVHSHEEICKVIRNAGFKILNNELVFRECSDLIIAIK